MGRKKRLLAFTLTLILLLTTTLSVNVFADVEVEPDVDTNATITIAADDKYTLYVDGDEIDVRPVSNSLPDPTEWKEVEEYRVSLINDYVIAVKGDDLFGSIAGMSIKVEIDGQAPYYLDDSRWKVTTEPGSGLSWTQKIYDMSGWEAVTLLEEDTHESWATEAAPWGWTENYMEEEMDETTYYRFVIPANPSIDVEKIVDPDDEPYALGDTIEFKITVTNDGNVDLHNVTVTDELPNLVGFNGTIGLLTVGAIRVLTPSYVVTQDDIETGSVTNVVSAAGWYVETEVSDTDEVEVDIDDVNPSIDIEKTVDPNEEPYEAGDTIEFKITVTNDGNVDLEDVTVTDELPGLSGLNGNIGLLTIGAIKVLTPTYVVTEADVLAESIINIATAAGWYYDEGEIKVTDTDDVTVDTTATLVPGISITKTVDPDNSPYAAGDIVTFKIVIENIGDLPLSDVMVDDSITGLLGSTGDIGDLAVGEVVTLTPSYEVTQDDIDAGYIYNYASVTAVHNETETELFEDDYVYTDTVPANADLTIVKTVDQSSVLVGTTVNYTITVTNTGNQTLYNIEISDPMFGGTQVIPNTTLAPEEEIVISGLSKLMDTVGTIINTATVTASRYEYMAIRTTQDDSFESDGPSSLEESDTATVVVSQLPPPPPVVYTPSVLVSITPDSTLVPIGTDVTFTMVVTNTGNTILNNVTIVNNELGFNELLATPLFILQSRTFTVTKTMSEVLEFTTAVNAEGISPQSVVVVDNSATLVSVYEEEEEEEEIIEEEIPEANPVTGAIPFTLYGMLSLITLGAAVVLINRKREEKE